ncbi:hypothetical protein [Sphingomonas cavernae]|uniref:Lipoprotein n=1 Tax=Sphingomonas cavernae TaxID=2320861 RepID=A0A418WK79_9SPHN|nr:hypothetical protein [Sphingomonas cavernae]RJF90444.1 hypothetical protein D3876_09385 [Sphingomonas cavernae]
MKRISMLALLVATAGCGASDNDPGAEGVTTGEVQALNDAAEMLDDANNSAAARPMANGMAAPDNGMADSKIWPDPARQ